MISLPNWNKKGKNIDSMKLVYEFHYGLIAKQHPATSYY